MVNFICIGGNKCGTTWLYKMLEQHKGLALAKTKEPHYFSRNYHFGHKWYQSLWKDNEKRLKGEFSTTYFSNPIALDRIKKDCPEVKLLIILRDPVERSISHLKHLERESVVKDLRVILENDSTVYTNSFYWSIVSSLFQRFESEKIFFVQFEKLISRPVDTIIDILDFIGAEKKVNFTGLEEQVGKSYTPRSRFIETLKVKSYFFLKRIGAFGVIALVQQSMFYELFKSYQRTSPQLERDKYLNALEPNLSQIMIERNRLVDSGLLKNFNFELWPCFIKEKRHVSE